MVRPEMGYPQLARIFSDGVGFSAKLEISFQAFKPILFATTRCDKAMVCSVIVEGGRNIMTRSA